MLATTAVYTPQTPHHHKPSGFQIESKKWGILTFVNFGSDGCFCGWRGGDDSLIGEGRLTSRSMVGVWRIKFGSIGGRGDWIFLGGSFIDEGRSDSRSVVGECVRMIEKWLYCLTCLIGSFSVLAFILIRLEVFLKIINV